MLWEGWGGAFESTLARGRRWSLRHFTGLEGPSRVLDFGQEGRKGLWAKVIPCTVAWRPEGTRRVGDPVGLVPGHGA